jgi:3-oxoacid CoA-transferase A subunit
MMSAPKTYKSLDAAVADIPDGATIGFAGFGGVGVPSFLIGALVRQGARRLTCVSNTTVQRDIPPGGADMGAVVTNGQLEKAICAFTAPTRPSQKLVFSEYYEAGKVDAEIVPQGTLAERLRAAGAGIPAFYTPAGVGTEIAQGKETRVFNGRTFLMEHALPLDYAFLRAWRADEMGNLQYRLSQRNFNPIMAMAARVTIVEVEEDILPAGGLDPDHIHTPSLYVHRMVKIDPKGMPS